MEKLYQENHVNHIKQSGNHRKEAHIALESLI